MLAFDTFVDAFFDLQVFLVDGSGNPRSGMSVPLSVTLLDADTTEATSLADPLADPLAGPLADQLA